MKFYQVLPQYDQRCKNLRVHDGDIYIANELYTPHEVERQKLNLRYMREVHVSKDSVYWFFGARFSDEVGDYEHE